MKYGKIFTQGIFDCCKRDFARIETLGRIWFRSFPLHFRTYKLCGSEKLSDNIKKPWLKATLKEIKNVINNQTFLVEDQNECEPVTPCMDVYKAKIRSDGSLDKLKLGIVVRGDLQNKKLVGDTRSPTASTRTLKYFLSDAANHNAGVHQLDFIGAFLQAKVKNRVFVKLESRYAD